MPGQMCLVGGEEFRAGCEEMDQEIMLASGQNPARVVIIPTAAVTGPAKAANDGVTHFAKLGGDASQLMVLEREHANDKALIESSRQANVIYFTGGSPDHLLTTIKDSEFLNAIVGAVGNGTVLAGSSAGAMVMGSMMRRPREGGWIEALGRQRGPHHEKRDPAETSVKIRCRLTAPSWASMPAPGAWEAPGTGRP